MEDSEQKTIEQMRENKDEYVDEIVEESDIESKEERKLIEQAIDEKIIQKEFAEAEIEDNKIGFSLVEDIKHTINTKGASRSRAKISNIQVQDDDIKIKFSIIGKDETFEKTYEIPDSESLHRDLKDIFILTNTEPNKPRKLKNCTVPVKPLSNRKNIEYIIHPPPRKKGLESTIKYKLNRITKRLELVRHRRGLNHYEDVYTPTGRVYTILLSLSLILLLFGSIGSKISPFVLLFTATLLMLHGMTKDQHL